MYSGRVCITGQGGDNLVELEVPGLWFSLVGLEQSVGRLRNPDSDEENGTRCMRWLMVLDRSVMVQMT